MEVNGWKGSSPPGRSVGGSVDMWLVVFLVELCFFLPCWVVLCCFFFLGGGEGERDSSFWGIRKVKVCCCWKDTKKGKILCSLSKRGDHRWISQILCQSLKKGVNRSVAWVFFRYISTWLVVSTHLKNLGQNGNLSQTGVKFCWKKMKPPPSYRKRFITHNLIFTYSKKLSPLYQFHLNHCPSCCPASATASRT